jgi:hypothetical protein
MTNEKPQSGQVDTLYFAARCMECVWTILIRHSHGIHYPGLAGLICWVVMMFFASSSPDPEPVLIFVAVWIGFLLARRGKARELFKKGVAIDSVYAGTPGLMLKLFPKLKTEIRAKTVEPFPCMLIAFAVMQFHEALGMLLMIGAWAMVVTRFCESYANYRQAVMLRDAELRGQAAKARATGQWDEF